jgi:CHAT domain-containing protein
MREGRDATREAFLREIPDVDVFHFAGHGITNGGLGGLVVGGEPSFLTAERISRLNLSKLELVVLSGCSTGVDRETQTVNADTLVRGFLDAGATRVVASSWDVDSVATRGLMSAFYKEILTGRAPAAALRNAMLLVASGKSSSHPSAWAAFELYEAR